jgi:carboxylesterase
MTNAPDIIYVVHGSHAHTWWRHLANGGYPWWRRWSLFCSAVRQAFGRECEIREFCWSGKNTDAARLKAGDDFARAIEKDSPQRQIHLIGHSHGGNVALVAVNRLPHQRVESIVLLANPNIALLDSRGQPPEWLYWGDAPERVARIWNLYSPEDLVQGRLVEWFHGVSNKGRKIVLTRQRYPGTERHPVQNGEIHWSRRRSAHSSMHSEMIGSCAGALLKGATIPEAMRAAGLSETEKNSVRDRGGWPGTGQTFEMLRRIADPRPFDFGNPASRVGALFVHGFTASPAEMRPMAHAVAQSTGWRCKGILLPGHGTQVEDMAKTNGEDWMQTVQREYEALSRECEQMFLVGLSLGAVLCCHAALRHLQDPRLRGLVLVAPAFGVTPLRRVGIQLLRPFHNLASKGKRASDYFLDNRLYSYLHLPMNLAAQVVKLGGSAARGMEKLRVIPVVIFAGDRESTVSLDRMLAVARDNTWIRLVRLPRSRHILTVEPDKEILFETSVRFMEQCLRKENSDGHLTNNI